MKSLLKIISFFIFPYSLIFIHAEGFRGFKNIFYFASFKNFITLLALFILFAFYFLGYNSEVHTVLSYTLAIMVLSLISLYLWMKKITSLSISENKEPVKITNMLRISLPMMMTSSMIFFIPWSAIIILGIYRSAIEIGVYDIAIKITWIISIVLFAANSILAPMLVELYSSDINKFRNLVQKSTKIVLIVSTPLTLLFMLFPLEILNFFGNDFAIGKHALMILSLGQFISAMSGPIGYILQMTGNEKIFNYIILSSLLINFILCNLLIPKYGIEGAAFSNLISIICTSLVGVLTVRYYYSFWILGSTDLNQRIQNNN